MNLLAEIDQIALDPALKKALKSALGEAELAQEKITQITQQAQAAEKNLHAAHLKIAALTLELAHHRRLKFGQAKETFHGLQADLFDETHQSDLAAIETELAQISAVVAPKKANTTPRPRAGRQPLPSHLPRIEHRHDLTDCTCGQCGHDLVQIGEDITEQLDCEPTRFFVHKHIRPQYACRTCETMHAEVIPPAIIEGGSVAPGLLTWVTVSKFTDHLPLYRLEQMGERCGVPLPRSNLAEWVGKTGVALAPLAARLAELLRTHDVLHADETPVRQLDPGQGKTKRAYLWAYRSNGLGNDPPIIVFDYQTSRAGHHAHAFLERWRGALMVDDYGGYKALFQTGVVELACWAHVRRKFFELHAAAGKTANRIAQVALQHIATLYQFERETTHFTVEQRAPHRKTHAHPALAAFHAWLIKTRLTVADGSGTAKAIDHTLKRWEALARYADNGSYPIDNNPVENAIRPIAIGKKNWLFAGSERAGIRAAAIQSLFATAKANGIDPYAWLKDTLEKLPSWPNSRIDELLPLRRM